MEGQAAISTPQALADAYRKSGYFDALRKHLFAEFVASSDKEDLLKRLDEVLPPAMARPSFKTKAKKDRHADLLLEVDTRHTFLYKSVQEVERSVRAKEKQVEREGGEGRIMGELDRTLRRSRGEKVDEPPQPSRTPLSVTPAETPSTQLPTPPPLAPPTARPTQFAGASSAALPTLQFQFAANGASPAAATTTMFGSTEPAVSALGSTAENPTAQVAVVPETPDASSQGSPPPPLGGKSESVVVPKEEHVEVSMVVKEEPAVVEVKEVKMEVVDEKA